MAKSTRKNKPKVPRKRLTLQSEIQFRDGLVIALVPVMLAEFLTSGGPGMAWDGYDDLADSLVNVIDEIESRFL